MSIQLNGRVIEVVLRQNTGDSSDTGAELDISSNLVSLGEMTWSVDENLTKISLGNLSLTVSDDESASVWTFLTDSIASGKGILPPWCYLTVDGTLTFIGIIKESPSYTQDAGTAEITINAVSWASMLETRRIRAGEISRARTFNNESTAVATGPDVTGKSVYNKELRRGHDRTMVAVSTSEQNNFSAGDSVYVHNYSDFTGYNKLYPVLSAGSGNIGGLGGMWCLNLGGGFSWQEHPGDNANFGQTLTLNRAYTSTSNLSNDEDLPFFTVAETWDAAAAGSVPKTSIRLTYTGGLLPGDKLDLVTNVMSPSGASYSLTIVDVDPISNTVYLDSPISNSITTGITSFQVNAASIADSVNTQVLPLIGQVLPPFGPLDTSAYQPLELPSPCFSFISPDSPHTQSTHVETLCDVADIQTSLTGFEVRGKDKSWAGLPTEGWDPLSTWTKTATWTEQLATAPAHVMPYVDLPADAVGLSDGPRGQTRYPDLIDQPDSGSTDSGPSPSYMAAYDYSNLRRYLFGWEGAEALQVTTWNGSTWSPVTGFDTGGVGYPVQIVSMPGTASAVGSGNALLALYANGTIKTILGTAALTASLKGDARSSAGLVTATLIQTPNGIYYTTPTGYGTIRVVSGALDVQWKQLIDMSNNKGLMRTITPISSMVYSNGKIITLAKVSYKTSISDARFTDDTYMLQLSPDPNPGSGLIYADFICGNIPRATMMVRSPVSQDVFGFMGSRLFQVATRLPDCVERFNSTGQTPASILEFAAAMTNTVAIPFPDGSLRLYSRGLVTASDDVTVDIVSQTEARWNKHLADCVVIKGFNSCQGVATTETQQAGLTISYSNEVYIRNSSQARSIAESYLSFFAAPRRELEQVWWSDASPAPWEALKPMQVITINGGETHYYLTGLSINYEAMTAKANLLEVIQVTTG